jgi:transposase
MQKCPKCGYNEGRDWPGALMILAFGLVSLVSGISGEPKSVQLSIGIGSLLFVGA